jgi:ribosomal protein L11 methylase PrmA
LIVVETCDGGRHATTRLAAAALAAVVRAGDRALDAGTGDGFLARHLSDLGARVVAIDLDPRAAGLRLEGVEGRCLDAASVGEGFDVVVANLPQEELERCLPALVTAARRALVVTGARLAGARRVRRRLGGLAVSARAEDGWCCFTATRDRRVS